MAEPSEYLTTLAAAIADGQYVDWDAAESGASSEDERRHVRQLRAVHGLASPGIDVPDATFAPPIDSGDQDPTVWGHLRVLEQIGRGKFGTVYRAHDPRLVRDVALKVMRYQAASLTHGAADSAVEEGRLLARVHHRSVVTVYGAERIGERVGIWMELIDGHTLEREIQRDGPMPARVAEIGVALCHALAAVHRAGLIHRDVKAQNVMHAADGRIVLMDFGTGRETAQAAERELAGTPLYLAPEIIDGDKATPQTDIYSLSVLLFRVATGTFPARGGSLADIRASQRGVTVQERKASLSGLPSAIVGTIERGLSPQPQDRFQSAEDMATALQRAVSPPRAPRIIGAAAAIAILLVASAWIGYTRGWFARAGAFESQIIWSGADMPPALSINRAGDVIAYVTPDRRNVAVRTMPTQATTVVSKHLPNSRDLVTQVALTDDGKQVAYVLLNEKTGVPELHSVVVGDATSDRTLIAKDRLGEVTWLAWSPNGRELAAALIPGASRATVALVDANSGAMRDLAVLDWRGPMNLAWSPDGRFIACDLPAGDDTGQRDIFVIDRASGKTERVRSGPEAELLAGWTERGVFYLSDRSSESSLWVLPVVDGRAAGAPAMVRSLEPASPLAMTAAGDLVVTSTRRDRRVQVASVDLNTGRLLREPVAPVLDSYASFRQAGWSLNGRQIAYMSVNPRSRAAMSLLIRNDLGILTEVPLKLSNLSTIDWAPDGRAFIGRGADFKGRWGLFHIDAATGDITPFKYFEEGRQYFTPHWSRDGRRIYFTGGTGGGFLTGGFYVHDARSGAERTVFLQKDVRTEGPGAFPGMRDLRMSPDETLVSGLDPGTASKPSTLWVVRVKDKVARELLRIPAARAFTHNSGIVWTRDSKALIVNRIGTTDRDVREIWLVPVDGRAPYRLDVGNLVIVDAAIAVHPDMQQIAFSAGDPPKEDIRWVRGR